MVGAIKMDHTSEFFDKHVIAISDVFIHPDYNPANNTNSIALFKLSTSLNRSERPICLDAGSPISNNMKALATGFGFNKGNT